MVPHQQILRVQKIDRREEPLPFIRDELMQTAIQKQRHARQVKAEGDALDDRTDIVIIVKRATVPPGR